MISEQTINQVIDNIDTPEALQASIETIVEKQPYLAAYLKREDHSLLTPDEYSFLWFMIVVLHEAYETQDDDLSLLEAETIEQKEETIWEWLNDSKSKNFRDKLDPFFEMCPEEDLLAFIEDSLVIDEDGIVTEAGREFLFVPAATLLFSLCL